MIEVTLKFGLTKQVTREVPEGTTVRQLMTDPNNRAILGFGENVAATIDVIVFEQQAAAKA